MKRFQRIHSSGGHSFAQVVISLIPFKFKGRKRNTFICQRDSEENEFIPFINSGTSSDDERESTVADNSLRIVDRWQVSREIEERFLCEPL